MSVEERVNIDKELEALMVAEQNRDVTDPATPSDVCDGNDVSDEMPETAIYLSSDDEDDMTCLLYTSPSPRDQRGSRMPSSA